MDVLMRLELGPIGDGAVGAGAGVHDVVAHVEPSHTAAELTVAFGRRYGVVPPPGYALVLVRADGELVPSDMRLEEVGLVSGEALVLRAVETLRPLERVEPAWARPGSPVEPRVELVVASGPDVSARVALGPEDLLIGRDRSCGLALADPNVARVHLRATVAPASSERVPVAVIRAAEDAVPAPPPVMVNGVEVDGPAMVTEADIVRIGATTLRVAGGHPPLDDPIGGELRPVGEIPFHRTPYYRSPVAPHVFEPIGEIPDKPEAARFAYLAALAPLAMGLTMAVLYSPRMLIFAVFSPMIAVAGYFDTRRRNRVRYTRGEDHFRRKVAERRHEIATALADERQRRLGAGPDLAALAQRAASRDGELWIRGRQAADMLHLRLGLGDVVPAVTVEAETRGDEVLRQEFDDERSELATIVDVPITVDLCTHNVVGLVGSPTDTTDIASSLVLQAACLYSPEDLVILAATGSDRSIAAWLKWLPQVRSASSPLAIDHLATGPDQAGRLLRELLAVAEARVGERDRAIDRRWPWMLAIIDQELEPPAAVVARLLEISGRAGISAIWLTASHDRVPRQAQATVACCPLLGGVDSIVAYTDPDLDDQPVEIERVSGVAADVIARSLAPVRDASSSTGSTALPRNVTLHDALAPPTETTPDIDACWVANRWHHDRSYSLLAPIGVTVGGPFVIDLVEHGPHALIGGTSGSGKSELLMSMVAGLIAYNPPTKVNLLFVDYKGGASSDLFADVPHTVGYVTNLDAMLARRALISLRAELNRRMDLLKGKAKDLADMIERHPSEAPPSLVIVIDEFATLVKEIPEFVAGIVDVAQRGRSLGIHLILATQRPSGAVNENILANTNLRISLRMLDGAESTSVIGTNDAATIPTPLKGRGFARIGPGELIAFQSAWSGAPCRSLGDGLGGGAPQVAISAFDSAIVGLPPAPATAPSERITQIDQLIAAVQDASEELELGPGRSPWHDELPTELPLRAVLCSAAETDTDRSDPGRRVAIGLIDDPEGQTQYRAVVDFELDGGLAIFGTGGSGKTTALETLAVSAAIDDSANGGGELTIFGLDFASRRLGAVSALPQCAAVAPGDDLEAVTRIIALLDDLLQQRRGAMAAATSEGRESNGGSRVLVLIDDYGNLAQAFEGSAASSNLYRWLETVNRIIVDGRQVGIHTALTATRRGVVKAGLLSAISNRIVLRQADMGGYAELGLPAALVGDVVLPPGRGFVNGADLVQVASASARETGEGLSGSVDPALITAALASHVDPLPPGPEPLIVPLGFRDQSLDPVWLDLSVNSLTILGDPRSGRSSALATIGQLLAAGGVPVWAIGPEGSPLARLDSTTRAAFGKADALVPSLEDLIESIDEGGPGPRPVLLVDDFDLVDDPLLDGPMLKLSSAGVRFVASTLSLRSYSTNQLAQDMKRARSFLYLQPPSARDVQEVTGCLPTIRPGLPMPPGRGVLVVNRLSTVLQVSYSMPCSRA